MSGKETESLGRGNHEDESCGVGRRNLSGRIYTVCWVEEARPLARKVKQHCSNEDWRELPAGLQVCGLDVGECEELTSERPAD